MGGKGGGSLPVRVWGQIHQHWRFFAKKKGIYYIVINFCFMTNLFHEVKCSLSIMAGNKELSFWCGQYMVTCEDGRSYILP